MSVALAAGVTLVHATQMLGHVEARAGGINADGNGSGRH